MTFCGIDTGTRVVGYAIVDGEHVFRSDAVSLRRNTKLRGWESLLERYENLLEWSRSVFAGSRFDLVGVEWPWVGKNAQTAIKLGVAFGIVMASAMTHGLSVVRIEPAEAKMALTGSGNASKEEMVMFAKTITTLRSKYPEDESDAIGVALAAQAKHDRQSYL